MEYTSNKLAKMSGITARTLRHYDNIGLLKPIRTGYSGYRIYSEKEVDTLQQILFYKELGFALSDIKELLSNPTFDRQEAFNKHLSELQNKRQRLDVLINNVTKSIAAMKGELAMTDKEKFEGFKQDLINRNEQKYGAEIREKYGDDTADKSNAHLKNMSKGQFDKGEELRIAVEDALKSAFKTGDPASKEAYKTCELHRKWLQIYSPDQYNKEYHKALGEMYVADPRFKSFYDEIVEGGAEFLRDAINVYCN